MAWAAFLNGRTFPPAFTPLPAFLTLHARCAAAAPPYWNISARMPLFLPAACVGVATAHSTPPFVCVQRGGSP